MDLDVVQCKSCKIHQAIDAESSKTIFKCTVCTLEQDKSVLFSGSGPDCRQIVRERNDKIMETEEIHSELVPKVHMNDDRKMQSSSIQCDNIGPTGNRWKNYLEAESDDSE